MEGELKKISVKCVCLLTNSARRVPRWRKAARYWAFAWAHVRVPMANLMIYFELWQRKEKNRCASGAKTLEIFKISSEFFRKTMDFFKISLEIFWETMDLSFSCSDACEVGRAGAKSKERERQNSVAWNKTVASKSSLSPWSWNKKMYLCIRLLCAKVVGRQPPNEDAGNEANEEDFHRFIPP